VDLTIDRNQYKIFDFSTISLDTKNYLKSKTITIVHLRSFPKWTSPSIKSLDIQTDVLITKYTENKEWIEVTCNVSNKKISGWIPAYSIDTSEFYKLKAQSAEKNQTARLIKDNYFKIKLIRVNKMKRCESEIVLNNQEKTVRFEIKTKNLNKSESIQRLEEVKLVNNSKMENQILDKRHKRKALSILFKLNLYHYWKKWRNLCHSFTISKVNN